MKCERCLKDNHYLERCSMCGKACCKQCQHDSKTKNTEYGRKVRLVCCDTCWTNPETKKKYENGIPGVNQ